MTRRFVKRAIVAASLMLTIPAAMAVGGYPPSLLKQWANADMFTESSKLLMFMGYTAGFLSTVDTLQSIGAVPKLICVPAKWDAIKAINELDPAGFPETDQGGTTYMFMAFAKKYPC